MKMEQVQCGAVGPFWLETRATDNSWSWSVHDVWYDGCVAFGDATSMEKAQEAAEGVAGLKPEWFIPVAA
jgi:hypothetical protein